MSAPSTAVPMPRAAAALPGPLRRRLQAWWLGRHTPSDTLLLTQRNVYILPTRAGLMFGATLVVLLLASINYQLNLGYVLTFLLAGSGIASMHLTHNTLRGLTLHLRPPPPVHAGAAARLDIALSGPPGGRARHGIGLRMSTNADSALAWTDVPAGAHAQAQVGCVMPARGWGELPPVILETRFPLGLFRAWSVWRPASRVLVYPRLEFPAAPLPAAHASAAPGPAQRQRPEQGGETEGLRAYRRGDSLKQVLWKKSARPLAAGGDLVSRDTATAVQHELWLDWQQCAGLPPEERLSRLAAWVVAADGQGADHGLRLPGVEIPPSQGDPHRRRCLEALALWQ